ncbi:DUF3857 and transglutaminase domain-containing protein [Neolewinella lacunae]|uniref:DUF3857 and transglutaminase domain-containing protein n=1 Tax=Neolewinella lacunae TaxID=1517758 RepID=A0A923PIN1_9BACT|nr:DUF3857 and transglutaminase domain-containing protein [Neolewinella lacunae]MBC6993396.1 DUF3857 and transglutaminase domain-containing protein [Neolewinella lacunae]MDN3635146.1 DUF3857 and transglutaminase domain-containing protein [Neolewinella lacunae]
MKSLLFIVIVALGCCGSQLIAQDDPGNVKFGQVSEEDLKLTVAPGDSTADAYVLYDLMDMRIEYTYEGRPGLRESVHRRVKLLRESSFDRAEVQVIYSRQHEKLMETSAMVHLPNGEKIKLRNSDFIRERYDDERDIFKFTFPGLTPGAIIEYEYQKTDEFITVPSRYYFQESVPVRWTEYRALIPAYFNYISLGNGGNFHINKTDRLTRHYGSEQIAHTSIQWAYRDLPAFKHQPYVNNFTDYIPQVRLQLQSVRYPNQATVNVFSTWGETTKDIHTWPSFGLAYRNRGNYGKAWKELQAQVNQQATDAEKVEFLYNYVAGRIEWDGYFSWTSEHTPNQVFDAAKGSSGEKAMLLLALLREAGFNAQPVLVPLRDTGSPLELYPLMTQFRHLMVVVQLDGKEVLLDPNDVSRPPGLPRVVALNHRAFVADPENPHWMDVDVPSASQAVIAEVVLAEDGLAEVSIQSRLNSYFAFDGRTKIKEKKEDLEMPLVDDILGAFPEAELVSYKVKEEETLSGPLSVDYQLKVPMGQPLDDYLYVQPILCPMLDKGMADVEERLYPVDFSYPWQRRYITNIKLPEGYAIEELPESIRLISEDGSLVATFAVEKKDEQTISLNFTVNVKRTVYAAAEYPTVRDMFRRIIDLQQSTLVLKRT